VKTEGASYAAHVWLALLPNRSPMLGLPFPEGMLLPVLLTDPFIQDVMNSRGAPAPNPVAAGHTGALGPSSPGDGPNYAAAGPTGASAYGPVASGPTGATSYSPAAAGPTGTSTSSWSPAAAGPTGASTISSLGGGNAASLMGVGGQSPNDGAIPASELCGWGHGWVCEQGKAPQCYLLKMTFCTCTILFLLAFCWLHQ
jgi:hypothetical protein